MYVLGHVIGDVTVISKPLSDGFANYFDSLASSLNSYSFAGLADKVSGQAS